MTSESEYLSDYLASLILWIPGGLMVICTNSIILTTFLRYGSLRKEPGLHSVILLAMFDILNGLFNLSSGILYFCQFDVLTTGHCMIRKALSASGKCISEMGIVCIAIDRLCAIKIPLEYRQLNFNRITIVVFLVVVSYNLIVMNAFLFIGFDGGRLLNGTECPSLASIATRPAVVYYASLSLLIATVVLISYTFLARSLQQHFKQIKNKKRSEDANVARMRQEVKVTKSISIVLVVYIVSCLIPNVAALVMTIVKVAFLQEIKYYIVAAGGLFNSSINILIYSFTSEVFKKYLTALFRCESESAVMKNEYKKNKAIELRTAKQIPKTRLNNHLQPTLHVQSL